MEIKRKAREGFQSIAGVVVHNEHVMFGFSKNDTHVWKAWLLARQLRAPVPEWVNVEIDRIAMGIMRSTTRKDVDRVLGLKKGPNARAMAKTNQKKMNVVREVLKLIDAGELDEIAFAKVGLRYKVEALTAKNYYYELMDSPAPRARRGK